MLLSVTDDPLTLFAAWLAEAEKTEPVNATAAALATVGEELKPSVRMVLLKHADAAGFVFYTNLESRKAEELRAHPTAALCFYWKSLHRQVRIEGSVDTVSDAEADAYFASRERESQIAAWASPQSQSSTCLNWNLKAPASGRSMSR